MKNAFSVATVVIFGAGVVGWILNIMQIVQTVNVPVTGLFIAKCFGVFVAPLGAVLGLIG